MKYLYLLVLIQLMILNSYGNIKVKKDDFSGSTIISMKYFIIAEEIEIGVGPIRCDFEYKREFNNDKIGPVVINLTIDASTSLPNLTKKAIFKIDSKMNDLILSEISKSSDINVELESGDDDSKAEASSDNIFNTTLTLTNDIENQIINCNSLTLRLFFGNKPATFILSKSKLKDFKEFLQKKP